MVPKEHMSRRCCVIVDLSSPLFYSVHDGIQKDLCSLHYVALDDALKLICCLRPGILLVIMDLKDAYQMVPVHPVNQYLLGISWNGEVYIDCALPFGLCSAPKIFTAVTENTFSTQYLDDFLFMIPPNFPSGFGGE